MRPYSQHRSNPTMTVQSAPIRLAVIDTDSAFTTVLGKRLEAAGWEARFSPGSHSARRSRGDEAERRRP